jgi:hypothetical protein
MFHVQKYKKDCLVAFTVFTLELNKLTFNNMFISCQCGVIGTFRAYLPIFRLYLSATYIYVISKRNKCSTYQKGCRLNLTRGGGGIYSVKLVGRI